MDTRYRFLKKRFILLLICSALWTALCAAVDSSPTASFAQTARAAFPYRFPPQDRFVYADAETVVGNPVTHIVKKKETLLDIARNYGLGFNEMEDLYPDVDPWIPKEGTALVIPSQWILPQPGKSTIIVNVAELRLYHFMKNRGLVRTFPIGIGDMDFQTPVGKFTITEKRENPAWYIPKSLQKKYGIKVMPPGPENPLGDYWLGLGNSSYGIHGTDIAWSVGRLVTHGCIRLYPEGIASLYPFIEYGTPVEIIYEPVKLGIRRGRIYVEAHRDIYNRMNDFMAYAYRRLSEKQLAGRVDMEKFNTALIRRNGLPVDITPGR